MNAEAILPWVAGVLQGRYQDQRRAYIVSQPGLPPWPKRRSRKRKPIPGVYDLDETDG